MTNQIPVCSNGDLSGVYGPDEVEQQKLRIASLARQFALQFDGHQPSFIARSPGRVNLIGEHIDYSLYSVLPMALSDKDILIAVRVFESSAVGGSGGAQLRLRNVDSTRFPDRVYALKSVEEQVVDIDHRKHEWSHYFLSGLKGVLMHAKPGKVLSMDCLVDGRVPAGAGVSSSSAFVCCAALATVHAYGISSMSKKQLTECAIVSERFVGVESGGMDQSASIFGERNVAMLIHFFPELNVQPVPLPSPTSTLVSSKDDLVFVVAHTLVTADKHVSAPVCYNLRVVETRLASLLLATLHFGKQKTEKRGVLRLRDVQEWWMEHDEQGKGKSFNEGLVAMEGLVEKYLTKRDGYALEEVAELLGTTADELKAKHMSKFPVRAEKFQLYKRAKHVFSEALRVFQFQDVCNGVQKLDRDVGVVLGDLMNRSQDSCRDLFECSCPEIDELATIARKNGALGSRLTGAGWGGCTVSLVPKPALESFTEALKKEYYSVSESRMQLVNKAGGFSEVLFASEPGRGGVILENAW